MGQLGPRARVTLVEVPRTPGPSQDRTHATGSTGVDTGAWGGGKREAWAQAPPCGAPTLLAGGPRKRARAGAGAPPLAQEGPGAVDADADLLLSFVGSLGPGPLMLS